MSITSSLADFSIPEIFQFLERGQKTGLLMLSGLQKNRSKPMDVNDYIWVYHGRIVAAASQVDHEGLVGLIAESQEISKRVITKLAQLCPSDKPLGLSLKNQCVLSMEQLKQLFQIQVLQRVSTLLELEDGEFRFIPNAPIPTREMTGLTIPMTEATLVGLRMLQNWDALADKLPAPSAGLVHVIAGEPHYQLNSLEWQVWQYAEGTVSLRAIAEKLSIPIEKVQHIAFTLATLDLVEEVPLLAGVLPTSVFDSLPVQLGTESQENSINSSFVQGLVSFLRGKGDVGLTNMARLRLIPT